MNRDSYVLHSLKWSFFFGILLALVEVSGEFLGRLFGRLVLPNSRALGAGLPGFPGSCPIELLPPSRSGRAATAAAPVHLTLRQPCFPRKLRLHGCWRCLRLRILSGEHLWVVLPAWYPSSASSPSPLVASWSSGSGACLQFFPFSFSFRVFVTPRSMDGELEWDFPSGCSSFSFGFTLPPQ